EPRDELLLGGVVDESQAEGGRGDAEDDVVRRQLAGEVRLRLHAAGRRVDAAGDRVEPVDAAVRGAVGVLDEPGLPDRTVGEDERGNYLVASRQAVEGREGDLRIDRAHLAESGVRARATDGGLRMAGSRAIG